MSERIRETHFPDWAVGWIEGYLDGMVLSVLEVLTFRFGTIPADLEPAVRRVAGRARLKVLLRLAVAAPDLAAFRQRAGV